MTAGAWVPLGRQAGGALDRSVQLGPEAARLPTEVLKVPVGVQHLPRGTPRGFRQFFGSHVSYLGGTRSD